MDDDNNEGDYGEKDHDDDVDVYGKTVDGKQQR